MAFPPVPFQEWFLRQTSTGNAALNAYVARVKADGGVVEAIGCVPQAVWDWVAPVAPSFVGLLDLYPNAAAAYSLRKLRAAYSGSAVRVRRSSDNTEQDIGFDANGDLDSTALLAFVNADVNQYTSDFSSTEDLNESNGTGAAAQSVGGVNDAYKFTLSGGAVSHFPRVLGALNTSDTFNISFDFYIPSSNSSCDGIQLYVLAGSPLYNTLDAWTSVSLTNVTSNSDQLRFYATDGGSLTVDGDGDVFYLKNIVITQTTADGHVTTWYDQSLSNDATQGTAANQPKIVSAGSLVTENGKPAVQSSNAQVLKTATGVLGVTSQLTVFSVLKYDTTGQANDFSYGVTNSAYGGTDDTFALRQRLGNFQSLITDSLNLSQLNNGAVDTNQHLITHSFEASTAIKLRNNGAETTDITGIPATLNLSKGIEIFSILNTIVASSMKYQELVFYKSLPTVGPIEANLNTFYSIYP